MTATFPQYEPFQVWQEQAQGTPLGWACAEGGEPGTWVNISSIGTPSVKAGARPSSAPAIFWRFQSIIIRRV